MRKKFKYYVTILSMHLYCKVKKRKKLQILKAFRPPKKHECLYVFDYYSALFMCRNLKP